MVSKRSSLLSKNDTCSASTIFQCTTVLLNDETSAGDAQTAKINYGPKVTTADRASLTRRARHQHPLTEPSTSAVPMSPKTATFTASGPHTPCAASASCSVVAMSSSVSPDNLLERRALAVAAAAAAAVDEEEGASPTAAADEGEGGAA